MPNESLSAEKETYAAFNHNLFIQFKLWLWLHMFILYFANLGLALCSVKLVTLKGQMSRENPSFTNHPGNENWIKRREAMPELQVWASPSLNLKNDIAISISFEHLIRYVEKGKSWKSEAPSSINSNASKINKFEDFYKEIWQKHWALCSLKSALDILQCWSKTGITHLIGVHWGWIKTISCPMHGSYYFLHDLIWTKRKFVKGEAATKCKGGGDHDAWDDRANLPLRKNEHVKHGE
jgi:hypothetical protein